MAILNPKDDYTFLINGQSVTISTGLNLKTDGEVKPDGMCLSQKLEGTISCTLKDDIIKKNFKHKLHEYQQKTGKPKSVVVPESFIFDK